MTPTLHYSGGKIRGTFKSVFLDIFASDDHKMLIPFVYHVNKN